MIEDYSKGLTITSSSAKKEDKKRGYGVSPVFKNYSANEIKKLFNVDFIKPDKDLLTSSQVAENLGGRRFYRPIKELIMKKKIKKVGRGFGTNGIMDFYKPISKQKYKNLMKIDILIPDKFFTLKQLCNITNLNKKIKKKFGTEIRKLHKKLKIAKITPVGKVISNTAYSEFSNVYKMINKKQFSDLKKIILKKNNHTRAST